MMLLNVWLNLSVSVPLAKSTTESAVICIFTIKVIIFCHFAEFAFYCVCVQWCACIPHQFIQHKGTVSAEEGLGSCVPLTSLTQGIFASSPTVLGSPLSATPPSTPSTPCSGPLTQPTRPPQYITVSRGGELCLLQGAVPPPLPRERSVLQL